MAEETNSAGTEQEDIPEEEVVEGSGGSVSPEVSLFSSEQAQSHVIDPLEHVEEAQSQASPVAHDPHAAHAFLNSFTILDETQSVPIQLTVQVDLHDQQYAVCHHTETYEVTLNVATTQITQDRQAVTPLSQVTQQTEITINFTGILTDQIIQPSDSSERQFIQSSLDNELSVESRVNTIEQDEVPQAVEVGADIGGDREGTVTEDTVTSVSGNLTIFDTNPTQLSFVVQTGLVGTGNYGTLDITSTGSWTYTLNNALSAVQGLKTGGGGLLDDVTVTSADGTTQVIRIRIQGTDDAPSITGTAAQTIQEGLLTSAVTTTTGMLTVTDLDLNQSMFQINQTGLSGTGNYGTLDISTSGNWTYTLDNTLTAVQELRSGDPDLIDDVTVLTEDGTSKVIRITIEGTDDAPVITGHDARTIQEGLLTTSTTTATGILTATDLDLNQSMFQINQTGLSGTGNYGTLDISTSGNWTYTLDNTLTAVQELRSGDPDLIDDVTVLTEDGTSKVIRITIEGTDDAPVITGHDARTIQEGLLTTSTTTATGTLTVTDLDLNQSMFQINQTGLNGTGNYGTLDISTSGSWTYTLNNTLTAVQALKSGDPDLIDDVTVLTEDGTSKVIRITIEGTDDAPVITGHDARTIQEGLLTTSTTTATGTLTATDLDLNDSAFQAQTNLTGTGNHGSLDITSSGSWTYTLDNTSTTVQALTSTSADLIDDVTVLTADGTSKVIRITIEGTDDTPVITGHTARTIQEGLNTSSTTTATGTLTATDLDLNQSSFQAQTGLTGTGNYGMLDITSSGSWTYTLNNTLTAVQGLRSTDSDLIDDIPNALQDARFSSLSV